MKKLARYLSIVGVLLMVLASMAGCQGGVSDYSDLPGGTALVNNTAIQGSTALPGDTATAATEQHYSPLDITVMTSETVIQLYSAKDE